nr:hypothetical protein [Tanacetum cinerariifolium]
MPEDPYAYVVAAFQALPPPDYVPGPKEPEQAPPLPVYIPYVPEPVYPEYIPPEDDVFPAEEQPLPATASPTAESPGYILESDPDEDPKEDDDEDPEEDPADYLADHDDDDERSTQLRSTLFHLHLHFLFKKVSDQKDNTQDTSKNTKFAKQPIAEILPKIGETNALSKPVTSNSVSKPPVSKGVNNDKVIAPGMFWISPDKVSREAKKVPNT